MLTDRASEKKKNIVRIQMLSICNLVLINTTQCRTYTQVVIIERELKIMVLVSKSGRGEPYRAEKPILSGGILRT